MMPETFVDDKGRTRYIAPCCGTELSKSGYYKHMSKPCPHKNKKSDSKEGVLGSSPSTSRHTENEGAQPTPPPESSWMKWEPEIGNATESLPTPLKFIAGRGKIEGSSQEDIDTLKSQSRAILALGLTAWDSLATKYARAITEDEEYLISHTESDKALVADAQARWLESRGLLVAEIVGEGTLALALTSWFVVPPLAKAQRKANRGFISPVTKGRAVIFLSKIPLVGRIFRRKKKSSNPILIETENEVI
jgi:hypothetical protein